MSWIQSTDDGVRLCLRLVPRASRDEISGVLDDALKIRLQAPPIEGKANRALVKFLAKRLGVTAGRISIVAGDTQRNKRVAVQGVSAEQVRSRLLPQQEPPPSAGS